MARPLRIEFAGALYHVMARGNARETIYRDDDDRLAFSKIGEWRALRVALRDGESVCSYLKEVMLQNKT